MRVAFANVEIAPPTGWLDITDDLDDGAPPTLAREAGVGAIQFSVALYGSGEALAIDESALHGMLRSRIGSFSERIVTERTHPCLVVGAEGMMESDRLGAWFVSDGANVAFITYVGAAAEFASVAELVDARTIAHSLVFPTQPSGR